MPPPPVTPSPHRFVIKKERTVRNTLLAQEHAPRPSTHQFNATPRFNFSSTPIPTSTQHVSGPTPSANRYLTPASKTPRELDGIEVLSDDQNYNLHDSIEIDEPDVGYRSADGHDECNLEEPSPKRRRLSTSPIAEHHHEPGGVQDDQQEDDFHDLLSSSLPILSSPPAPRRPASTTAPRFLPSTPASASIPHPSTSNQATFLKPPRFRPPDPSEIEQTPVDPLPDHFSPYRRGQKYVPGGLAAEVRDWLVNIESAVPANVAKGEKDEPWLVRILVDEISGGGVAGMVLVRGRQVHIVDAGEMVDTIGEVKVILAGESTGTGLQKGPKVEIGRIVGIKGPVWEVVVEGERWGVGVDWKILR